MRKMAVSGLFELFWGVWGEIWKMAGMADFLRLFAENHEKSAKIPKKLLKIVKIWVLRPLGPQIDANMRNWGIEGRKIVKKWHKMAENGHFGDFGA